MLILVVALIIFGPGRIPEIARTIGRVARNLRKATSGLTTTITKEIDGEEKDRPLQPRTNSGKNKDSSDIGGAKLRQRND